ncbi:unnamed protein product [Heligmosomoides polygyrus]|uniref:Iodothyronine deiodinase n=1 Tax=Heligmosomoides polygyrus TaxID=6339 RepID=A0A183F5X9_HELPZ|nr:unnamed protein product [Heligmosomoides polygyrus]
MPRPDNNEHLQLSFLLLLLVVVLIIIVIIINVVIMWWQRRYHRHGRNVGGYCMFLFSSGDDVNATPATLLSHLERARFPRYMHLVAPPSNGPSDGPNVDFLVAK